MVEKYEELKEKIRMALKSQIEDAIAKIMKVYRPKIGVDTTLLEQIIDSDIAPETPALAEDVKAYLIEYKAFLQQEFCYGLNDLVLDVFTEIINENNPISLGPLSRISYFDEEHKFKAQVIGVMGIREGVPVNFEVVSGLNAGLTGTDKTNARGIAVFKTVASERGRDVVKATFDLKGVTIESNEALVKYRVKPEELETP